MEAETVHVDTELAARLRAKYPDDALERLVRSDYAYYSTHGDYVPELAKLLLIERAVSRAATEPPKECGSFGCTLPKGHNRGRADVPENHLLGGVGGA